MTTLASCVEYVLGEAPPSDDELAVRDWLATRGLGLVPILAPDGFEWPGRFLTRWPSGSWAVLFGVPPGVVFGEPEASSVTSAFMIASHEPSVRVTEPATSVGRVELIIVAAAAEAPVRSLESAVAVAGRGLEGDRYFDGAGTFSRPGTNGRDVTLVSAEALEATGVEPVEARRNLVVRGIDLDGLIGRAFRVGDVECMGRRRCEPCAHMQRLSRPGTLRALVHRGGLRADVVVGGVVHVGDEVALV